MSFIQSLFRRFFATAPVAASAPVALNAGLLKSVVGGNGGSTDSPKNTW